MSVSKHYIAEAHNIRVSAFKTDQFNISTMLFFVFANKLMRLKQARNLQLGTPGGAKSFPRGTEFFLTMSNCFTLCPTHFSRGDHPPVSS